MVDTVPTALDGPSAPAPFPETSPWKLCAGGVGGLCALAIVVVLLDSSSVAPDTWFSQDLSAGLKGVAYLMMIVWILASLANLVAALLTLLALLWFILIRPSAPKRRVLVPILAFCVSLVLILAITLRVTGSIRLRAFERAGANATPLIAAIDTYESRHGNYPPTLDALTPKFLDAIPRTGLAMYPEFQYFLPEDDSIFIGYQLFVPASIGPLNWDKFVYWPSRDYPDEFYYGRSERLGDWAYVHE